MKKIAADKNYDILKKANPGTALVEGAAYGITEKEALSLIDSAVRAAVGEYMHGDGGATLQWQEKILSQSKPYDYVLKLIQSLKLDIGRMKAKDGKTEGKITKMEAELKERIVQLETAMSIVTTGTDFEFAPVRSKKDETYDPFDEETELPNS